MNDLIAPPLASGVSLSRFLISALLPLATLGASSASAIEVSGNLTLVSDYVYRGISQTSENPAVQGGFDFTSDSGSYGGIWASNVDFDGSIEIDFYVGYAGTIQDKADFDLGVIRYEYPDDGETEIEYPSGSGTMIKPDSSFNEFYGSIGYKGVTAGFAWSNDFFYESGKATYLYLDYEMTLKHELVLSFHYGSQSIDKNGKFGYPDYADYSVGLSRSFEDFDLSIMLHDTDLKKTECGTNGDICEGRIVVGFSRSL